MSDMDPTMHAITTAARISYVETPGVIAPLAPAELGLVLALDPLKLVDVLDELICAVVEEICNAEDAEKYEDREPEYDIVEPTAAAAAAAYASMLPDPVAGVLTPRTMPFLH